MTKTVYVLTELDGPGYTIATHGVYARLAEAEIAADVRAGDQLDQFKPWNKNASFKDYRDAFVIEAVEFYE